MRSQRCSANPNPPMTGYYRRFCPSKRREGQSDRTSYPHRVRNFRQARRHVTIPECVLIYPGADNLSLILRTPIPSPPSTNQTLIVGFTLQAKTRQELQSSLCSPTRIVSNRHGSIGRTDRRFWCTSRKKAQKLACVSRQLDFSIEQVDLQLGSIDRRHGHFREQNAGGKCEEEAPRRPEGREGLYTLIPLAEY